MMLVGNGAPPVYGMPLAFVAGHVEKFETYTSAELVMIRSSVVPGPPTKAAAFGSFEITEVVVEATICRRRVVRPWYVVVICTHSLVFLFWSQSAVPAVIVAASSYSL